MFQQLYELGQILPEVEPWEHFNEGMPDNYDRGLAICFDPRGKYIGIRTRLGNADVVYRSGPPNGFDFTPCSKLTKPSRTVKRLHRAIGNLVEAQYLEEWQKKWLVKVINEYESKQEEIGNKVEQQVAAAGIDKDHRGYLFIASFEDGMISPIYNWETVKHWMATTTLESFARHKKQTTAAEGKTCSICGHIDRRVYGNFSILACYNLDKLGTIAGGFSKSSSAKNFPVCEECAPGLSYSILYARKELAGYSAGQQYFILPFSSIPEHRKILRREFAANPQRLSIGGSGDLFAQENEILAYFDELAQGNLRYAVGFSLIFFREENASWRIQAEVNEILPSRIGEIHEAISLIEQDELLFSINDKESKPMRLSTNNLRSFAEKKERAGNKIRSWLVALFSGEHVDRNNFLHDVVSRILAVSKSTPKFFPHTVRQAWGIYQFAILTGLIERMEERMNLAIPKSSYGEFVNNHKDFFYSPELITSFLTGCYASVVCSVQRKERNVDSAPFAKKFLGRLMDRDRLMRIYRDGHDKLGVYNSLGLVAKDLDPDLADSWINAGSPQDWQATKDELSFAFVLGYSLQWRIHHAKSKLPEPIEEETI
ncbi:MAG: CRISPR-associated protein [Thermoleophilia bacterium]|nr:CRISPR-associated protein [Thermoleophilia bacterium]